MPTTEDNTNPRFDSMLETIRPVLVELSGQSQAPGGASPVAIVQASSAPRRATFRAMNAARARTAAMLAASSQVVDSSKGLAGFSASLTLDQAALVAFRAPQTATAAVAQTSTCQVILLLIGLETTRSRAGSGKSDGPPFHFGNALVAQGIEHRFPRPIQGFSTAWTNMETSALTWSFDLSASRVVWRHLTPLAIPRCGPSAAQARGPSRQAEAAS